MEKKLTSDISATINVSKLLAMRELLQIRSFFFSDLEQELSKIK